MEFLTEVKRVPPANIHPILEVGASLLKECILIYLTTCRSYTILQKRRPFFSTGDTEFIEMKLDGGNSATIEKEISDLVREINSKSTVGENILTMIKPITVKVRFLFDNVLAAAIAKPHLTCV